MLELLELTASTPAAELGKKIRTRRARVGIVGLGHVGLPLAVEFARAGFCVTGIDISDEKTRWINAGASYLVDIPSSALSPLVKSGKLRATTDFSAVRELDTINICVPTPLRKTNDPDMSYVMAAADEIGYYAHSGMLVVLESTSDPGTTEEVLLPILEGQGMKAGDDFFLCFSAKRGDTDDTRYQKKNIRKVVGGVTRACAEMGALFYSQALYNVVPVSSTSVAEMVKLIDDRCRTINIGLMNEIATKCDRLGLEVGEIIDAAATKSSGFSPLYPGPDLGRPAIPHPTAKSINRSSMPASRSTGRGRSLGLSQALPLAPPCAERFCGRFMILCSLPCAQCSLR